MSFVRADALVSDATSKALLLINFLDGEQSREVTASLVSNHRRINLDLFACRSRKVKRFLLVGSAL